MKNAIGSAIFYARFALPFSRIGFQRRVGASAQQPFDFEGQRWIVTGASGGIGRAIALGAAAGGAHVLALARSPAKLEALRASATGLSGVVEPWPVDLSLMHAVRDAGASIAAQGRVDVLVNNVGVMFHGFEQTAEGVEAGFATNLLGHWVLVQALEAGGALDAASTVISMSSGGMYGAKLDLPALEAASAAKHDGFTAYAQHKRAQLTLTDWWNQRQGNVPRCHAMQPGWVATPGVDTALPTFRKVFGPVLRTPEQGADTALWLAATRPAPTEEGGIWLDRHRDPEHAFALTRGGAGADALAAALNRRAAAILQH